VILGGGFAGARVTQELAAAGFTNVTLIDRKEYFEVTYASLRALIDPEIGKRSKPYKPNPIMSLVPIGRSRGFVQLPFATLF